MIQLRHWLMPAQAEHSISSQAGSPLVALAPCELDKQPEHYLQGHKECCSCPKASGPCHVALYVVRVLLWRHLPAPRAFFGCCFRPVFSRWADLKVLLKCGALGWTAAGSAKPKVLWSAVVKGNRTFESARSICS